MKYKSLRNINEKLWQRREGPGYKLLKGYQCLWNNDLHMHCLKILKDILGTEIYLCMLIRSHTHKILIHNITHHF